MLEESKCRFSMKFIKWFKTRLQRDFDLLVGHLGLCPQTPGNVWSHSVVRSPSKKELKNCLPKENGMVVGETKQTVGRMG